MNFFFNKPKEKGRAKSDPSRDRGWDPVHEIVPPDSLVKKQDPDLLNLVRTSLESKTETTWYSHNAPAAPRSGPMDERFASRTVSVEIGTFLQRIPPDLLREGPHDPKRKIEFKAGELVAALGQKKPSVPISSIAKACPELFLGEISPRQDVEIYFPWHWVAAQLSDGRIRAEIKSESSSADGEGADPAFKAFETGAFESKINAPAPGDESSQEFHAPSESPGDDTTGPGKGSADIGPCEPQTPEETTSPGTLQQERDRAIRQRDEALAEVERLKIALRHTSEALEAVCNTGLKGKDAV